MSKRFLMLAFLLASSLAQQVGSSPALQVGSSLAQQVGSSLAQQIEPRVPPPRQPQEPAQVEGSLEVQVSFKGQPAQGIQVSLWELGPGGRLLAPKVRPFTLLTDAAGLVRWTNLGRGSWVVRVQAKDGFSVSLPTTEGFLAAPLQVGPYNLQLRMGKP